MPRKRESKETMTDVSPEKPSPSTTDPNPRPAPTSPQNTISASPKSSPTTSPVNSLPPSPVPHVSPASPGEKEKSIEGKTALRDLSSDLVHASSEINHHKNLIEKIEEKIQILKQTEHTNPNSDPAQLPQEKDDKFRHIEGELQRLHELLKELDLEKKIRATHIRRMLSEDMVEKSLEELEDRLDSLQQTQSKFGINSESNPTTWPWFYNVTLGLIPVATALTVYKVLQSRR